MKTVVVLGAAALGLASAQHPVEQSLRASGFDWRKTELGNMVGAVRNFQSIPGKACGAIEIPDSVPGIYQHMLKDDGKEGTR